MRHIHFILSIFNAYQTHSSSVFEFQTTAMATIDNIMRRVLIFKMWKHPFGGVVSLSSEHTYDCVSTIDHEHQSNRQIHFHCTHSAHNGNIQSIKMMDLLLLPSIYLIHISSFTNGEAVYISKHDHRVSIRPREICELLSLCEEHDSNEKLDWDAMPCTTILFHFHFG